MENINTDFERYARLRVLEDEIYGVERPAEDNFLVKKAAVYNSAVWEHMHTGHPENALKEGSDGSGGYLVPDTYETRLVEGLAAKNVFRRIAKTVPVKYRLRIPQVSSTGAAEWVPENTFVPIEDVTFGEIEITLHKIGTMVMTKSISRFARNTVTLLATVREMKAVGVDIFFGEQNLHTLSADGELMLTILASYAEEESRSVSENQKWRVRKNFEGGMPWNGTMLGYRYENGKLVIVPEQAELVRRIYDLYLSGLGIMAITKALNADGAKTRYGNPFGKTGVTCILRNYCYTGNLLLQQTYRENHLTKRTVINCGALPKYHATDTHEAIIPLETFEAVQREMAQQAEKHTHPGSTRSSYPFTGLIVCDNCGKRYRRKVTATGPVWICSTFNSLGKAACPSKQIPEAVLLELTSDMPLGDLTAVRAKNGNELVFCFKDGSETVKRWKDRSRAESWSPEMKAAARQKALMRNHST